MDWMFVDWKIGLLGLLIDVIIAVWLGHVAEGNGVKYWHAFFVTVFLGPVVGLLYTIVKAMNPTCKCSI